MKIVLASVVSRRARSKAEGVDKMVADYTQRAGRYVPVETLLAESEAALLAAAERQPGRPAAYLVLLDSRGQTFSSEEFAQFVGRQQDGGTQRMLLGIGPADGWSDGARKQAQTLFSLGRITLPHELARVVLAEQVYRALTILAGHPYHGGH
ncbi:23S rRNA (pseudouridine1915-N3)-methyltransferase [Granulicella rosea]|uniref:Ribosomal RNA large subunit methyltransferase H n=1 Tax=Granulicella rosea TaxID=474952 RepID=A0A239LU81_9BACT|nr:23S rRNA (pseudouridine(1915)-N(3))-methyltransferase RlmH [Granulicella rosea]SNT33522.1 23S rRNA (pseudouridine1915-N3)-methyltransferase [Granulicella rosea]